MTESSTERKLAAILHADVVGYSRLMGEDETDTLARLTAIRRERIEPLIKTYGGRIVKLMGDGILAEFSSVVDALAGAVELQRAVAAAGAELAESRRIQFRMGINLGDVIVQDEDIYGDGVNIAARLEPLAEPGGICISQTTLDAVGNKLPLEYENMGEQIVKNIAKPIPAYRVRVPADAAMPLRAGRSDAAATSGGRELPTLSWRLAGPAVIVLALGAAGLVYWLQPAVEPADPAKMAYVLPAKPSIAVLPFENMSADQEQEYFSDGLTEDIITNIARFPNLFVIARNSTDRYKDQAVDIRNVAQDLGVRYVLEGSVRRAGDTLRITAQLIDALSGTHVWAQRYDRKLDDIFPLQDEIAGEVASRLASTIVVSEFERRARRGTRKPEAYDSFLRGWRFLLVANPQSYARAVPLFEKAIELDPEFARPYAALASLRAHNVFFRWAKGPKDSYSHATELAERAVALDPNDELAHRMLGSVLRVQGDYTRAIDAYETALSRSPSNPDALISLAVANAYTGHVEEALAHAELAMRLNPHAPPHYWAWRGIALYMDRQFDRALASFKQFQALNPRIFIAYVWLAASYAQLGIDEEAQTAREEALTRQPRFTIRGFLERGRAQGVAEELIIEGFRKAGFPEK